MSQIQGQTLEALVQSSGPLPETQALHYIRQVGSILSSLHHEGKLHRGINPQTITQQELGVTLQPSEAAVPADKPAPESPTVRYLPIEQTIEGLEQTPATDIYSLAATLYYLLTGHPPIAASLRQRVPLSDLRQLQPNLSLSVEQAIAQGMQVEATWRPQTVESWLSLLPEDSSNGSESNGLKPKKPTGHYKTLTLGNTFGVPTPSTQQPISAPEVAVNSPVGLGTGKQPVTLPLANAAPPRLPTSSPINPPANRPIKKSLLTTATIALLVGASFGLALRFGLKHLVGSTLLHRDQSFPVRGNWPDANEIQPRNSN